MDGWKDTHTHIKPTPSPEPKNPGNPDNPSSFTDRSSDMLKTLKPKCLKEP